MSARKPGRRRAITVGPPKRPAKAERGSHGLWWLLPALWIATMVAYQPAWHGGVLWDDNAHLTRAGLRSVTGLWRIWFDVGATQQYYPVVHSTFWALHRLFGDDTLAYHLLNISLHTASAFLVALILRRLAVPGAVLAAAIFALHPVQVESVAWMTELKNTLSGALALGAALAYLKFDQTRRARPYALAIVLFLAALLSKTVTAVLPAALLVIFWWWRGTIRWREDVRPLVPCFVLGLAGGLTTAWVERTLIGARGLEFQLGPVERVLLAGRALWFYVWTLLWPTRVTFMYPKWTIDAHQWRQCLFPVAAVAVLAVLWRLRSRSRAPFAAILLYGVALMPALGFVDVYPFRYTYVADHFAYLAIIPLVALASAGLVRTASRWLPARRAEPLLVIALGMVLTWLTWSDAGAYVDADTLYRTTLARNPACWMCHNNLATPFLEGSTTEVDEAAIHLREALRLNPDYAEAHYNLGALLQRRGQHAEALREHTEALRLKPDLSEALYSIGVCEQALGRLEQAIGHYSEALRLQPGSAPAHYSLGTALQATGRFDDAVTHYREALAITPDFGAARCGLGMSLAGRGMPNDALTELRECVRLVPGAAAAHDSLGSVQAQLGNNVDAIAEFRTALQLQPNLAATHYKLAITLAGANRTEEAAAEFRNALTYDPTSAQTHHDLGAALANLGRMREAIAEFREALRLQPDYADAKANLDRALRLAGKN
jgi:tetratricopeptide (TPR) repeat protein